MVTFNTLNTITVPVHMYSTVIHNVDDTISMFHTHNNTVCTSSSEGSGGEWSELFFTDHNGITVEPTVDNLKVYGIDDRCIVFVWRGAKGLRMAFWPSDAPLYSPSSPHRLYYAVDTEKLFMNIADQWQYIATNVHENLVDKGTLTHEQLEAKIAALEQRCMELASKIEPS